MSDTQTGAPQRCPVTDWQTDFDHTDPAYAAAAPEIWDELRETCPVAHSDRFGGMWLPTRHADVAAIAHDTDHFSSRGVIVSVFEPAQPAPVGYAPPITSDPPFHEIARRLLLPAFTPGSHAWRPGVETDAPGLYLAGDGIRTEFPSALMERSAATGIIAANHILRAEGAAAEPVRSIRPRGLLAGRTPAKRP